MSSAHSGRTTPRRALETRTQRSGLRGDWVLRAVTVFAAHFPVGGQGPADGWSDRHPRPSMQPRRRCSGPRSPRALRPAPRLTLPVRFHTQSRAGRWSRYRPQANSESYGNCSSLWIGTFQGFLGVVVSQALAPKFSRSFSSPENTDRWAQPAACSSVGAPAARLQPVPCAGPKPQCVSSPGLPMVRVLPRC